MGTNETPTTRTAPRGRGVNIALWMGQGLLAAFFLVATAIPKLVGQDTSVETFDDIGLGQWYRYFVGVCELAGAIGLVIPALSGLAALGLSVVMVGALFTQLFVLGEPALAITPVLLLVFLLLIAWGRWPETKALAARARG
jgi:putative oxidoreductase